MHRVLYFSGYRSALFEHSGRTISKKFEFDPTETGIALLTKYLNSTASVNTYIIIDIVEEDFIFESVPLLRGGSLSAYMKRALRKQFRDNPRTHYTVIDRDPENNKRQNVCLSAITNPHLIQPLTEKLIEHNTPIAGVYSAPLLIAALAKKISRKIPKVIIISQHIASAVRFTFVDNGKLKFTRSTKIDYGDLDSGNYNNICKKIVEDLEETIAFIYNQKQLDYDDELSIEAILSPTLLMHMKCTLKGKTDLKIDFLHIEVLLGNLKLKSNDCELSCAATIACLPRFGGRDHYSIPIEREPFNKKRLSTFINTASALTLVSALFMSTFFINHAKTTNLDINNKKLQLATIQEKFNSNFGPYSSAINSGLIMQDTVLLYQDLKQYESLSPESIYIPLSNILAKRNYRDIDINIMDWSILTEELIGQYNLDNGGLESDDGSLDGNYGADDYSMDSYSMDDSSMAGAGGVSTQTKIIKYMGLLEGKIDLTRLTHRQAVQVMDGFTSQLESIPEVTEIKILKLPIDTRSTSQFKHSVDKKSGSGLEKENQGTFTIVILMESKINA